MDKIKSYEIIVSHGFHFVFLDLCLDRNHIVIKLCGSANRCFNKGKFEVKLKLVLKIFNNDISNLQESESLLCLSRKIFHNRL